LNLGRGKRPILQRIQTGFGTHTVFCPVGNGALAPGMKWPRRETDNFLPSSAAVVHINGVDSGNFTYTIFSHRGLAL
jgi:hypothetical protein